MQADIRKFLSYDSVRENVVYKPISTKKNRELLEDILISADSVKKAAKRIHEAGGCDATDEYGRGYDDAVTLALDIPLEETGYVIEDIFDYGEDREAVLPGNLAAKLTKMNR